MIASLISFLIMPWKLMENADSIFIFLNAIGAVLGPVAGVMIANYFFIHKQRENLDELYMDLETNNRDVLYHGINREAYAATILALVLSLSGQFIPALSQISDVSWFVGFFSAFIIYLVLKRLVPKKALETIDD
jgi:allantoin permease